MSFISFLKENEPPKSKSFAYSNIETLWTENIASQRHPIMVEVHRGSHFPQMSLIVIYMLSLFHFIIIVMIIIIIFIIFIILSLVYVCCYELDDLQYCHNTFGSVWCIYVYFFLNCINIFVVWWLLSSFSDSPCHLPVSLCSGLCRNYIYSK